MMKSNNDEVQSDRTYPGNSKSPIRILLFYRGLNARAFWQGLVEAQLKRLQNLAEIASARVTLEKRREIGPPFRVKALLEVPGPDFHAEASDHTLPAALHKVVKNLERQIQSRRARLAQRRKTHLQAGFLPRIPSMAFGGHRA
jgi:ribosome-associated translation inhibitor RaiA